MTTPTPVAAPVKGGTSIDQLEQAFEELMEAKSELAHMQQRVDRLEDKVKDLVLVNNVMPAIKLDLNSLRRWLKQSF